MGNGVSRVYPNGILKQVPVVERKSVSWSSSVQARSHDSQSWESQPLINPYEISRLQRQLKATAIQTPPVQRTAAPPRPIGRYRSRKEYIQHVQSNKRARKHNTLALGGLALLALILGVTAGPVFIIIPGCIAVMYAGMALAAHDPVEPYKSEQFDKAQMHAKRHLERLIAKHKRSGLTEYAQLYQELLDKLQKGQQK